MQKKYSLDLRDYDTSIYEKNPIVTLGFNDGVPPVGVARIAEDKRSVDIIFVATEEAEKVADMPLQLSFAHSDGQLAALSLVVESGL